jgi:hypothetical protein
MYEVTVTADLAYADADGQPLLAWRSPRPSFPPPCALPDLPAKE